MGVPNDVVGFDPYLTAFSGFPVFKNIYETLVEYEDDLTATPLLATEWTIADDAASVTVSLREDVTFHSGAAFNAESVVANIEKVLDPDRGQSMHALLASDIAGVEAIDDATVRIDLAAPAPEGLILDILEMVPMVDPGAFESLDTEASGTGPFMLSSRTPGQSIELSRFDAYWGESPAVETVNYSIFPDPDSMVTAFQADEIDILAGVPYRLADRFEDGEIFEGYPGSLVYELRINPSRPPFDVAATRQDLQHMVNREGIVSAVLGGLSQPTALPFSPSSAAYDPQAMTDLAFDPSQATSLEELGADGANVELIVSTAYPETIDMGQIIQADLGALGITVYLTVVEQTAFVDRSVSGDYNMLLSFSGFTQRYPTRITVNSVYRQIDNPIWGENIPDSYVDAISEASTALTAEEQEQAFESLRSSLIEESWVVSVAYNQILFAAQEGITGLDRSVDSQLLLRDVTKE